jgi:hypothetical protein
MLKSWELLIADEAYRGAATDFANYCSFIEDCIDSYVKCVAKITELAINDDVISAKLDALRDAVAVQTPYVEEAKTTISTRCTGFISDIDEADGEVYDRLIGY